MGYVICSRYHLDRIDSLRSHDLQVRHKLGPEDINRITHKAAAAAEAARHHSLQKEDARDKSAAGASRFRLEALLCLTQGQTHCLCRTDQHMGIK